MRTQRTRHNGQTVPLMTPPPVEHPLIYKGCSVGGGYGRQGNHSGQNENLSVEVSPFPPSILKRLHSDTRKRLERLGRLALEAYQDETTWPEFVRLHWPALRHPTVKPWHAGALRALVEHGAEVAAMDSMSSGDRPQPRDKRPLAAGCCQQCCRRSQKHATTGG